MLDHKYSRASLSAAALKGKDAHIVAVLDSLSKELGLNLGIAHIEHSQSGQATDYGEHSHYGRRKRYMCAYDDYDDVDVEMEEVENRTTSVENLVDLDGKLISRYVTFDDEASETIPANFNDYFEGEDWDDQEYEGYQGNVSAQSVPHIYLSEIRRRVVRRQRGKMCVCFLHSTGGY